MSGSFRFLSLVQPFMSVLPEVAQAERKIPFRYAAHTSLSVLHPPRAHAFGGRTRGRASGGGGAAARAMARLPFCVDCWPTAGCGARPRAAGL